MRLYIKQKVFSWGDRFFVKNENGDDRYSVQGKVFTWGKKLHIYASDGSEVAFIRQKLWTWLPRYFIEVNGEVVCTVVKEWTFMKPRYRIEGPGWQVTGDFWAHEYSLNDEKTGRPVCSISKKWFTWGDSYELDIAEPRDELLCLCVTLVIDCVTAQQAAAASAASSAH